jgi:hypothetical protein
LHLTKEALKAPFNSTEVRRFLDIKAEAAVPEQISSDEIAKLRQAARSRGRTNVMGKS